MSCPGIWRRVAENWMKDRESKLRKICNFLRKLERKGWIADAWIDPDGMIHAVIVSRDKTIKVEKEKGWLRRLFS